MELNANEIKKALECCGSNNPCGEECFGHDIKGLSECTKILAQNALALITSQEQRIGELTERNERLFDECGKQGILWKRNFESIYQSAKETVIADTVKKTISAIKTRGTKNTYSCMISGKNHETFTIRGSDLEEIEKELLGVEK